MSGTIKAIETVYKGYRFRSRLEARWALFFDLIGIKWTYEVEPLDIGGTAYLPDFRVQCPHSTVIHEVKPESAQETIQAPRVYLAGKMSGEHEWRGEASTPLSLGVWTDDLEAAPEWMWRQAAHDAMLCGIPFIKVGPFPCQGKHAGYLASDSIHSAQSANDHSEVFTTSVLRAALGAIKSADIVCAHIGTSDAYGTIAEIGYAHAHSKPLFLTIDEAVVGGEWSDRRRPLGDHGSPRVHDLWFVEEMAGTSNCRVVTSITEAQAFHAEQIGKRVPREYRVIALLGQQGHAACMTFGDPYHVCMSSAALGWKGGLEVASLCARNPDEAQQARSHRFDQRSRS